MSDEENIIDQVKFIADYMKHYSFNLKFAEAIEDFIDLYYREKEKNKLFKDKIEAKIEEIGDGTFDAKIVLQNLLKEN